MALGLDAGLASLGYGLVEKVGPTLFLRAQGTLHTIAGAHIEVRLAELQHGLAQIEVPDRALVAIEDVEMRAGQRVDPAGILGCAKVIGLCWTMYAQPGRTPRLFRNAEWRRAIGAGHGSPAEVRARITTLLGPLPERTSEHSRDALGLAIAALGAAGGGR